MFVDDMYVKGQYLKIDMEESDIDGEASFEEKILRPSTFAKSIKHLSKTYKYDNANLILQRRWTVVLGSEDGKYFAGSFKEVRLWKAARTDA